MTNGAGQPPIGAAWGKAGKEPVPHPLVCHAIDTSAVARLVFERLLGPRVRAELQRGLAPLGDVVGWTALLCGLHDIGKYSPAFQALRADLVEPLGQPAVDDVRWVASPKGIPRTDTLHGVLTTRHLYASLQSWGARRDVADALARMVGGHHGCFPDAASLYQADGRPGDHGGARWAAWRDAMIEELARLWQLPEPASLPWQDVRIDPLAAVGLAGLTSVSDWIASDEDHFPYVGPVTDVAAYAAEARKQARNAVGKLDWSRWQPPDDTSFARLFPKQKRTVRPVQALVERLSAGRGRPMLVVIEAPTGEGKTKAAFQALATLVRDLGLSGTYIAMPTRATSDQVSEELEQLLRSLGDPASVRRVYGETAEERAARAAARRRRRKRNREKSAPVEPRDVSIDHEEDSDENAQEWFTSKRGLLASLGVGTIDKSVMAAIRSRHMFVWLTAFSNKVVVVDEVHAYDVYTSGLLDRLLLWLGRLHVPVILLSATLPASRRQELMAAWHAGVSAVSDSGAHQGTSIVSRTDAPHPPGASGRSESSVPPGTPPYPRVTRVEPGPFRPHVEPAGVSALNDNRVIRLEWIPDTEEQVADRLLASVRSGGCAAVIHNLVERRADRTYQKLQRKLDQEYRGRPDADRPRLIYFTGRLRKDTEERRKVERCLRDAFGPNGNRPRAIVVATQVLEHSLDLDFDFMVSDLAPVDYLIQRAGRLHRHSRDESRGTPVLAITGVTDTPKGPRLPRGLTPWVYQRMVLLRTWVLLRDRTELCSPEDVPDLVNRVYGPADAIACPAGWKRTWREAEAALQRSRDKPEFGARAVRLPKPSLRLEDLFDLTGRPRSASKTRWGNTGRDQYRERS